MDTTTIDDYWQEMKLVARLPLPPQDHENDVFFLWHHSRERYGRDHGEIGIKITKAGERDYIHVKACFFVPRIILTVALSPPVKSDLGEEIGHVLDSHQEGSDRYFIAGLQAWYYSDLKMLMLWEVDLFPNYSEADPTQDFLLIILWQSFEQGLLGRFPDCEQIVTPGWEPKYDGEQFRAFLAARGYSPHRENTYHKMIASQKGETDA